MFKKVGFSRQETRHRKTIITITEPSICKYFKCEDKAESETKSRQDRDKIEAQKKNYKKYKNYKKTTTTMPIEEEPVIEEPNRVVVFYECLKEHKSLSNEDKEYLLRYPEKRVQLALKFAEEETPKISLMALLNWHCREKIPPISNKRKFTDQQRMAIDFNSYLHSIGQEAIYLENKNLILEGYMIIPLNRSRMKISLNNTTLDLKKDFEQSKSEQRKLKNG
jgi:hypothetical protein